MAGRHNSWLGVRVVLSGNRYVWSDLCYKPRQCSALGPSSGSGSGSLPFWFVACCASRGISGVHCIHISPRQTGLESLLRRLERGASFQLMMLMLILLMVNMRSILSQSPLTSFPRYVGPLNMEPIPVCLFFAAT